jgi:glycosyltransferase involved in cell wall biosynthesis
MMTAKDKVDFVVTMDADLQDDIHAIDEMIAKYYEGNDIVYGVRASRENEPVFIRASTRAFL